MEDLFTHPSGPFKSHSLPEGMNVQNNIFYEDERLGIACYVVADTHQNAQVFAGHVIGHNTLQQENAKLKEDISKLRKALLSISPFADYQDSAFDLRSKVLKETGQDD